MIKLNKIYTRRGDKGSTSLGDGKQVLKHSIRVETYGSVDEANAFIGLTILKAPKQIKKILLRIQNDLFDLGADLCTPEKKNIKKLKITLNHIHFIETKIDFYNTWSVDEIILLDVGREKNNRDKFFEVIEGLSRRSFVPLTVGGWITTTEEIENLLHIGASKDIPL